MLNADELNQMVMKCIPDRVEMSLTHTRDESGQLTGARMVTLVMEGTDAYATQSAVLLTAAAVILRTLSGELEKTTFPAAVQEKIESAGTDEVVMSGLRDLMDLMKDGFRSEFLETH